MALFLAALAIRIVLVVADFNPVAIYVFTPARMDVISAGAFAALAVRGPGGATSCLREARRAWFASATLLALIFLWRGGLRYADPIAQTLGLSLIAINGSSLVLLAFGLRPGGRLARFFASPFLCSFGKYSYAIYLFNKPILAVIRDTVYGREQFLALFGSQIPGQLIFYLGATAVTFACAFASWHLYEKHFLRLKRFARAPGAATKPGHALAPGAATLPVAEVNPAMPVAPAEASSKDKHLLSR